MTDTVRVVIETDLETDTYTYRQMDSTTDRYAFDIPTEQFFAWEAARQAWETVTEGLSALYAARETTLYYQRETEQLRQRLTDAQAAYDAHMHHARTETGGETP